MGAGPFHAGLEPLLTDPRNSRTLAGSGVSVVVEVIEKLEPTIGLEPMTCRLRSEDTGELSTTEPTLDDLSPPALEASPKGDGDPRSS